MRTLYEIGADLSALNELLFEAEGDITEAEAEAAIDAWLQETQLALHDKVDAYCTLIQEREAISAARAVEAKRLLTLVQVDENKTTRLRARLKMFFESHDILKLETQRFKLSVQANGGKSPLVINPDWLVEPAGAPEEFHKVRIELDKDGIRAALETGIPVEACAIGERGTHLRIR